MLLRRYYHMQEGRVKVFLKSLFLKSPYLYLVDVWAKRSAKRYSSAPVQFAKLKKLHQRAAGYVNQYRNAHIHSDFGSRACAHPGFHIEGRSQEGCAANLGEARVNPATFSIETPASPIG